jgi:hypothetical protein
MAGALASQLKPVASRAHRVMNEYSSILKIKPAGGVNTGDRNAGSHCKIYPGDCIIAVRGLRDKRKPIDYLHLTNVFRTGQATFLDGEQKTAFYRGELDFEYFALANATGETPCVRDTTPPARLKVPRRYWNRIWALKLETFRQTRPSGTSFLATIKLKEDVEEILGVHFDYAIGKSTEKTAAPTRFNRSVQALDLDWRTIPFAFLKSFLGIASAVITGGAPVAIFAAGVASIIGTVKQVWSGQPITITASDSMLGKELISSFTPSEADALYKQAYSTIGRLTDYIGAAREKAAEIRIPGVKNPYERMIISTGLNMDIDLNDYQALLKSDGIKYDLVSVTLYV